MSSFRPKINVKFTLHITKVVKNVHSNKQNVVAKMVLELLTVIVYGFKVSNAVMYRTLLNTLISSFLDHHLNVKYIQIHEHHCVLTAFTEMATISHNVH